MDERTEVTPEETDGAIQEERSGDAVVNLFKQMSDTASQRAIEGLQGLVEGATAPKPRESAVREVIADQPVERVPAGSAGRTNLAELSDARYRTLPPMYRFRTPDGDWEAQRYLLAIHRKDYATLREIAAEDRHARAAIAIGAPGANFGVSDGTGAHLLPLPLANYLQTVLYKLARMRQIARIFQSTTGDSLRIPLQEVGSTVAWTAEGAVYTPGEPTVSDGVTLTLQKLTNLSDVTEELLEGSAFNVGQWLTQDVAANMAQTEDQSMYQDGAGAAANEPSGLEASDTTVAAAPAYYVPISPTQDANFILAADLTAAHLVKMFWSAPEAIRRNASWSGGDQVMQVLSNLVDDQGRPILNLLNAPLSTVGDPESSAQVGTILGRPVLNLPGKVAGTPAVPTQDENRLYFGDFMRTYAILEKGAMRALASSEFKFNTDVITFKFTRKVDGKVIGNGNAGIDYVYTGSIKA